MKYQQIFVEPPLDFLCSLFIIVVCGILKTQVMAAENLYNYTLEKHEEWVRRLESEFGSKSVDEDFRHINTIIEVKIVKSDYCTLILTLDFGRHMPRKEHGFILCVYGTLAQIRSFIPYHVDSWDRAITVFKDMNSILDYSSLEAVKKYFESL